MSAYEPRSSQDSSRHRQKPLPVLLEAFPAPPSFIPPSLPPISSSTPFFTSPVHSPPPSLPPTSPLPPVPGPSPISEEETVLLLSSTRHRRSRHSTNSTSSSRRDSTATVASITSIGSNGVPSLSPSVSSTSSTSQSTNSSSRARAESSASFHSFSSHGSLSALPMAFSRSQQSDKSPRVSPTMEVAIQEEDDIDLDPTHIHPTAADRTCPYPDEQFDQLSPRIPPVASVNDSISSIDMRDLPLDGYISPPLPRGRASPDISSIISATPRPRKRTPSVLSLTSSTRSSSRPPSSVRLSQRSLPSSTTHTPRPLTRSDSLSELQYGQRRMIPLNDNNSDFDELERKLEGNGSESDSSLDLHTPFAHVMLRDGLISPRSKVIAQLSPGLQRPGSVASINSTRTKSGVYKDDRDTLKRRHRHRDGKLLKGGIGLTTGLGWSDSEDEDSPSPLTRTLSTIAKSRKSSMTSLRSTYSQQGLSRCSSNASELVPPTPRRSPSAKAPLSTCSSLRLPITPEAGEDESSPPPLPPKDPSITTIPRTSPASSAAGPRPLQLTQSSSVLRSSSMGHHRTEIQSPPPTTRLRTYSQPSSAPQSSRPKGPPPVSGILGKISTKPSIPPPSSKSTPPPSPISPSGVRPRSRIGTGMVYKRSPSTTGVRPALLNPPTSSGGGNLRRLRMPSSPLQSVSGIPPSPSNPGFGMEIGIAI